MHGNHIFRLFICVRILLLNQHHHLHLLLIYYLTAADVSPGVKVFRQMTLTDDDNPLVAADGRSAKRSAPVQYITAVDDDDDDGGSCRRLVEVLCLPLPLSPCAVSAALFIAASSEVSYAFFNELHS